MLIEEFMGGGVHTVSYSGVRDVEIVFSNTGASAKRGIYLLNTPSSSIENLRLVKDPGTKDGYGITIADAYAGIVNCEFENFNYGIRGLNGARILASNCNYINCNAGLLSCFSALAHHRNGTGSGLSYGLVAEGGIITKQGTQPTGSIADEQIICGQII
jgi:hypothetical protein